MTLKLKRPFGDEFKISSPMGKRIINDKEEFHKGYDFATPVGTPVKAVHDGAVVRAGWEDESNHSVGYGTRIMQEIEIAEGTEKKRYYVWYGHLSKLFVKEGDRVSTGQEIGLTGNTGRSTGPHCHVGCRERDTNVFSEIEWGQV